MVASTYIPTPIIRWVSFANVYCKKICNFVKIVNDGLKFFHKSDKERWSGAAAEVKNKWAIPFSKI